SVIPTSITTESTTVSTATISTTPTATTKGPSATTTKSAPVYLTDLVFRSLDNFNVELSDPNSQTFKNRAQLVISQLEPIYKAKYFSFIGVNVLLFRQGSVITETQLAFNSTQPIPTVQEISDTLFTAVINGSVNPLNITPYSISVNGSTLVFRSLDIFIIELSNQSSQAFKSRSELVRSQVILIVILTACYYMLQLELIYRAKYLSFISVDVLSFRPGSIITETQLVFNSTQPVPTVQEISDSLLSAVVTGGVDPLNIIPSTVSVNGSVIATTVAATTASSGLKIESSLLQATWLIIMAKILQFFL
ncbi:hypothetical protein cypCar_00047969, partial [Cyprinus carpio]